MKKTFKMMMAAVMTMAMVGFVACKKDDDKKSDDSQQQETYEESTSFEIIHNGQAVAAGATVEHTFTAEELDIDDADVALYVKNKTDNTLQRVYKVELAEGPSSMERAPICYGQCTDRFLPYTSEAVNLAPGTDNTAIQIHLYPSSHGSAHTGTYKVTIGNGTNLEDPQVCFVKFNW